MVCNVLKNQGINLKEKGLVGFIQIPRMFLGIFIVWFKESFEVNIFFLSCKENFIYKNIASNILNDMKLYII